MPVLDTIHHRSDHYSMQSALVLRTFLLRLLEGGGYNRKRGTSFDRACTRPHVCACVCVCVLPCLRSLGAGSDGTAMQRWCAALFSEWSHLPWLPGLFCVVAIALVGSDGQC